MVRNTLAEMLIRYRAIEFGDFTLASGAKSPYYIDVKSAVTHPDLLAAVADTVAALHGFDVIAGVAVGGVLSQLPSLSRQGNPMRLSGHQRRAMARKMSSSAM